MLADKPFDDLLVIDGHSVVHMHKSKTFETGLSHGSPESWLDSPEGTDASLALASSHQPDTDSL